MLAGLQRVIGTDHVSQERLYHADSPDHAYEIIHDEDDEDFNYFLSANGDEAAA